MAPEVIACDENPDSTYDCKVNSDSTSQFEYCMNIEHDTYDVVHSLRDSEKKS